MLAFFFFLLLATAARAQCAGAGAPCASFSDCCDAGNGSTCLLRGFSYSAAPTCASCPPVPHGCDADADCCATAPYGHRGWCRILGPWPQDAHFCLPCSADGGPCGGLAWPGWTPGACCAHAFQLCNTTSWTCYDSRLSAAPV